MDYAVDDLYHKQPYQTDQDEIEELEDDEEMEEEVGSEKMEDEDYEESSIGDYNEWPWLETFEAEETREGVPIAKMVAQRIDREPIRANFYTQMEEPTHDTCELAFDLFDRWGCVKDDFLRHPIKKGTGVWGKELNEGVILLFETITVDRKFRRQGIGKKLVQDLLAKIWPELPKEGFGMEELEAGRTKFAVVWPTFLNDGETELNDLSPEALEVDFETSKAEAISFWRSLGFRRIGTSRWFALAANPAHPSHKLSAQADYNPPQKNATQNAFHNSIQVIINRKPPNPEGFDTRKEAIEFRMSTEICLVAFVQSHLHAHGATHPSWSSVDKDGNTIAHLAVSWPELLEWLLAQPLYTANYLFAIRNHQGETPVEIFESPLKDRRVRRRFMNYIEHISDEFRGYNEKDTDTLLLLRGLKPTSFSPEQRERVKWGCTCGHCRSYLSPRVLYALCYRADVFYKALSGASSSDLNGWINHSSECLEHLSPDLVKKLHMKKHDLLRDGLKEIFCSVLIVLTHKHQIPTVTNVYRLIQESTGRPQQSAMAFLSEGGSIASIVLACFEEAISWSTYLGNGEFEIVDCKGYRKLPKCRNDNEFFMARNVYEAK